MFLDFKSQKMVVANVYNLTEEAQKRKKKKNFGYNIKEAKEYTKKRNKIPVGEIYKTMKKNSSLFMGLERYN